MPPPDKKNSDQPLNPENVGDCFSNPPPVGIDALGVRIGRI